MLHINKTELQNNPTPFYAYDLKLLRETLQAAAKEAQKHDYHVHYALKANTNDPVLAEIRNVGFGADCVSGNEVKKALAAGFTADKVVFAGVGKSDAEINFGLENDIFCFNAESVHELEVLNELAGKMGKKARIALRINPNVNAKTHHYITTGLEENKFGINFWELPQLIDYLPTLTNLQLVGLHFHIGSQITELSVFKQLCLRVNEIQGWFLSRNIKVEHLNLGGGLGVNYHEPDAEAIPDFAMYFGIFKEFLKPEPGQQVHFELGRALVAQCGTLVSKVLYIKKGIKTNFVILDAGMTELMRPALYQAYHKIENLTSHEPDLRYDVVGPICESSDCFGKAVMLPETNRGDLLAIRTAGAYGEVMSSGYNLREKAPAFYFEG
ncbi:diaminopimelate decarboxylase [Adhaeribacter terreus]|uniref:Diaminopimelate decarboxylase n=1 Tax=Adhaeribacter terreus TaxID=529703 RepID=A0ABW0EF98_9BACT